MRVRKPSSVGYLEEKKRLSQVPLKEPHPIEFSASLRIPFVRTGKLMVHAVTISGYSGAFATAKQ